MVKVMQVYYFGQLIEVIRYEDGAWSYPTADQRIGQLRGDAADRLQLSDVVKLMNNPKTWSPNVRQN